MKKVIAVVLTIIVLLAMPFNLSVFAASNTYDLDELGLQVTIPNGYSVITRDTPASAPIFNELGTTKSELISHFKSSSIYLNAVSDTYNEEVVVTMTENSISNFTSLSDTVLNTVASTIVNEYKNYGLNVSKYDIYQHSQAKFMRLYFTDTGNTVHGLQYYTIYDGKAMNFTMRSYEGSLSSRQETAIKTIVDSIKYDVAPLVNDPGEDTDSFVYTDTDSGVKFTVPENWKQKPFFEDREYIDVKFVSTKEDGCAIIYGSSDMWAEMSSSEKIGYTRSDINNSILTKADIAEMFSTTVDKISSVTYNGVEYFKCESVYTTDKYSVDISGKMTQLVYINNGWMYMFQFGGASTHKLYSDFESLIKSVQYPTTSNGGYVGSTDNTISNDLNNNYSDNYGNNSGNNSSIVGTVLIFVVLAIIIVAVVIAVVVASRRKNTAYIPPTNYAPIYNSPNPPSYAEPTIYCKNCGQALPTDSVFCHKCGAEIDKENYNQ